MQVSMPTQAPASPAEGDTRPESARLEEAAGDSPVWGKKAQKKNKQGLFAKLLEGLTVKTKKDGVQPGASEKTEGEFHRERMGKNLLLAELGINQIKNTGLDPGTLEDEAVSGAVSLDLKQNSLFTGEDTASLLTAAGDGSAFSADDAASIAREGLFPHGNDLLREMKRQNSLNNAAAGDSAAAGEERQSASLGATVSRAEREAALVSEAGLLSEAARAEARSLGDKFRSVARTAEFQAGVAREVEGRSFDAEARSLFASQQGREGGDQEQAGQRGRRGRAIEVRDLRSAAERMHTAQESSTSFDASRAQAVNAQRGAEVEIPVHLNLSAERGSAETASRAERGAISQNLGFEDALARELRAHLSSDIVQQASVIVRNGGEGTIRLSLHPASLGDVKIRLEMTENKITGHIIVESSEALRAFERELPVLEKAFRDSGFSETSLDMSLAHEGGDFGAGEQYREGDLQSLSPALAAARYDAEADWIDVMDDIVIDQNAFDPDWAGGDGLLSSGARPRAQVNLLV